MQRRFLSKREAAIWLGVTPATIAKWVKLGRIPTVRLPSNAIRVDVDELTAQLLGEPFAPRSTVATVDVESQAATT